MRYVDDLDTCAKEAAADETHDLSVVFKESIKENPKVFETPQMRDKEKGAKKMTTNLNESQFRRLAQANEEDDDGFEEFSKSSESESSP